MKLIEAGGACILAALLVVDGRKHVEVSSYHSEPLPARPFVVMSTFSGAAPTLSFNDLPPSHIPV